MPVAKLASPIKLASSHAAFANASVAVAITQATALSPIAFAPAFLINETSLQTRLVVPGAKMMGLKPIQTLPPSHPSLTTCSLKSTDIIPKTDPAASSCSGPEVFYAVDATSGTSR